MSVPRREETFGSLLRAHRLAAGLTQEALAERSGVSPRTIQEVEAGAVHPRRATALSLADALRLPDQDRDELLRVGLPRPRPRRRLSGPPTSGPERHEALELLPVPALAAESVAEPAPEPVIREPALVALPRPAPTNVPWPVSSLLGREAEQAAIHDLLVEQRQRLVTLTGVGGSGKTRLALQVATDVLSDFIDGVWFVELASASDPALVPRSVVGAIGVREVQGAPLRDTLLGFLRRKRLLLVLDNCEHLVEACAELAAHLLTACPDLAILATSREPLQIAGEQRRPVRPLDVPDLTGPAGLTGPASFEALAEIASVRLFVERARAIDPDFTLTAQNATSVAQVCARLDGIPLAIELAASRIGVLSAEQIAERLDGSFRLLASGTRSAPTRQQTMEAALDWSYDLLTPAEQAAFCMLSVFAGGFDLDAAERVASCELRVASDEEGAMNRAPTGSFAVGARFIAPSNSLLTTHNSQLDVLDVLGRLVDKSLVVADRTPDGRRYRLLEPVRQYAHRQLLASGADDRARAQHASYYAELSERAAPLLRGPDQIVWADRLERERDNLRAALSWAVERADVDAGLRLTVSLAPYWVSHGYLSEGRGWLHLFLTEARLAGGSPDLRLHALMAAGVLASWQGDLVRGIELLSETVRQAEARGDRRLEAAARVDLAAARRRHGDVQQALRLAEEGLRLGHELSDESVIAHALFQGGVVHRDAQMSDRAVALLEESVERYRRIGDARWAAIAMTMLGWAQFEAGDHGRAVACLREAGINLKTIGDRAFFLYALRGLAYVSHEQGEHLRAARWYGASEALRVTLGMEHPRRNRERDQVFLTSVHNHLTASEYEGALAGGEALTFDEVGAEIGAE